MTSYFTTAFICVFLPAAVLAYSVVPKRARWVVLLLFSYAFIAIISKGLIVFVFASTISVYLVALSIAALYRKRDAVLKDAEGGKREIKKTYRGKARWILAVGLAVNFGILVVLKYLGFFAEVAGSLLALFGVDAALVVPRIGIPIGISFYTMMAASYLIDVYRESVEADKHLGRIALFLCFFPQIMEGPMCRYGQTAKALTAGEPINRDNLYAGLLRVAIGCAKKIIIADRLELFVKPVFENYASYDGGIIALAAILYTVQLYCDFSGCMDVAIGIGRMFNVTMPENFRQPFFSKTASEFWQRWHITLGAWFKDYIYYPVSLSKLCKNLTGKARKKFGNRYGPVMVSSIALFCVWILNGLWHGAGSQYIFFGLYYFVLIVAGGFIEPLMQKISADRGINRESKPYVVFRVVRTLVVIFIGELFFRATDFAAGLEMFMGIFTRFSLASFADGTVLQIYSDGRAIDGWDYLIVAVFFAVVIVLDILKERGVDVCEVALRHTAAVRWAVFFVVFALVMIFGAYGVGYVPVDPMYAQF